MQGEDGHKCFVAVAVFADLSSLNENTEKIDRKPVRNVVITSNGLRRLMSESSAFLRCFAAYKKRHKSLHTEIKIATNLLEKKQIEERGKKTLQAAEC